MTLNLKKKVSSNLHKEFFICLREENFCIIIFHRIFFLCRNILVDWWLNTKSTKFDAHNVSAFIADPIKVIKHKSNGGVHKEYLLTYHFPIYHNYSTTCFNMLLHKSFLLFFMYIGKKLGHFDSNEGLGRVAKQLCCHVISCQNFWGSCIYCDDRFILQKKEQNLK